MEDNFVYFTYFQRNNLIEIGNFFIIDLMCHVMIITKGMSSKYVYILIINLMDFVRQKAARMTGYDYIVFS
jgi:hypothetical protein